VAAALLVVAAGAVLDGLEPGRVTSATDRPLEALFTAHPEWGELTADGAWVMLNVAWEQGNEPRVRALMALTLAASREDYFRLNCARILAFDLPAWRMRREAEAPDSVRKLWRKQGAEEALQLLQAGSAASADRWIEAANITLYGLEDRAGAAELYRRAAGAPGAPWHAGRIHAQLLHELGRDREAVEWLRLWLPRLPAGDPSAQRELVEARLAEWELELRSRGEPL